MNNSDTDIVIGVYYYTFSTEKLCLSSLHGSSFFSFLSFFYFIYFIYLFIVGYTRELNPSPELV